MKNLFLFLVRKAWWMQSWPGRRGHAEGDGFNILYRVDVIP